MSKIILITLALVFTAMAVYSQDLKPDLSIDIDKAMLARKEFIKTDPGLEKCFDDSYGYAILPTVGKGGFIVGGAHGKGILFENGNPVGTAEMVQFTIGGQIGGKSYAEVIFFKTESEFDVFTTGRYEVAVSLSAVALESGVSNNLAYSDGVAIITHDNAGLMAEAVVGGQKFSYTSLEFQ